MLMSAVIWYQCVGISAVSMAVCIKADAKRLLRLSLAQETKPQAGLVDCMKPSVTTAPFAVFQKSDLMT